MIDQLVGSILANRVRYLLAALAIAVASALTVVCLAVASYVRTAFPAAPAGDFGQAQAAVTVAEAAQDRDVAKSVERLKSVGEVYSQQIHRAAITRTTASKALTVTETPNARFGFYRLLEGKKPKLTNEIAISQTTAQQMRLKAGDTMTVTVYYKTPDSSDSQSFSIGMRVTGVYKELHRVARGGHSFAGYITPEAAKEWRNREGRPPADAETTVYAISAAGHSDAEMLADLSAIPGASVESRLGEDERGLGESLSRASFGAAAMAVAFALFALGLAGTVAWNAFRAAGAARRRQLALLATLGASSRRIRRMIAWEAVTVGGVASAIGAAVGMSLTKLVPRLVLGDPAAAVLPAGVESNPLYGLFALAAGAFVAISAAAPFVFRSREAVPLEVVDDSLTAAPGDGKTIRPTVAFGLVGAGAAVTFTGVFFSNPGGNEGPLLVVIGALALFRGIVGLAPSVTRRLGIPLANLFVGSLGGGRNRVRLAFLGSREQGEQGTRGKLARAAMATLFASTLLLSSAAVATGVAHANALAAIDASFPRDVDVRQATDSEGVGLGITASQERAAAANPNVAAVVPVYETKVNSDFGKLTLSAVDPVRASSALRGDSHAAYGKTGTVTLPERMRTAKTAKKTITLTGRDGKELRLSVAFGGVASPTVSLKDLRKLDDVGTPAALWLRTRGDEPVVEKVRSIAHDVNEASGDAFAKVTSALLRQRSAYSAAVDSIVRLLTGALTGLAVASGLGASLAISLSLSAKRRDFEILRAIGASGGSIRRAEAWRQCGLASAGMIPGTLLGILVSSGVGAAFFSCMGGSVRGALPLLGLVCVLLAEATTIGLVIYFTLRTLTGRHLAQSARLVGRKSNS